MKKLFIIAIASLMVISCSKKEQEEIDKKEDNVKVSILSMNPLEIPKGFKIQGEMKRAAQWSDKNGINWMVISENYMGIEAKEIDEPNYSQKNLYGIIYCNYNQSEYKELVSFQDAVKKCEYDIVMDIIQESLSITDLDSNGYAEVTLMYKLGCLSDLSPCNLKLMMIENGNKYLIRGNQLLIDENKVRCGGEMNIDKSFYNAPKEFLIFADKFWKKYSVVRW